jgi:hypothetical protein
MQIIPGIDGEERANLMLQFLRTARRRIGGEVLIGIQRPHETLPGESNALGQ